MRDTASTAKQKTSAANPAFARQHRACHRAYHCEADSTLVSRTHYLTRQDSSKNSAATILPGHNESGGVLKSITAQSGNFGT